MTYQQYGIIQASDYNGYVGTAVSSTANTLNAVLSTGNGRAGLGQTAVAQVVGNDAAYKITPDQWNALINNINNLASHQGSTVTPISLNSQGDPILAVVTNDATPKSIFENNLNTIYTNRNNCAAQGVTATVTTTRATPWTNKIIFTHTVTFESGDKARYFFNSGGQIALNFSHPAGTNVNDLWNKLAAACGTIYISGTNSGTQTIIGTVFNGISKIGGTGTPVTLSSNSGYYALSTTNTTVFKMLATVGPAGYLSSFIQIDLKTNGTQGNNGDVGSIITITTTWDEYPDGGGTTKGLASANSATTCVVREPGTNYITKTWGTVNVVGSVTGT